MRFAIDMGSPFLRYGMLMNVLLIRHAEPNYVIDSLTPKGFEQAEALAEYLTGLPVTHLYVSPMGRAQDTVKPTATRTGLAPVTLDWMREIDVRDEFWGCPWNHTPGSWPDATGRTPFHIAMEPHARRVLDGFRHLLDTHGYSTWGKGFIRNPEWKANQLPVLFCHGGLILTLMARLMEWPPHTYCATLGYMPTGITHLKLAKEKEVDSWHLRMMSFGVRPHLDAQQTFPLDSARY